MNSEGSICLWKPWTSLLGSPWDSQVIVYKIVTGSYPEVNKEEEGEVSGL